MKYCEIGAGANRNFAWSASFFRPGNEYVVLDTHFEPVGLFGTKPVPFSEQQALELGNRIAASNIREMTSAATDDGFAVTLIEADARYTEYPDQSFSQLVMRNVLGDPRSHSSALAREALRIAQLVTVIEEYSPEDAYPAIEEFEFEKVTQPTELPGFRRIARYGEAWTRPGAVA